MIMDISTIQEKAHMALQKRKVLEAKKDITATQYKEYMEHKENITNLIVMWIISKWQQELWKHIDLDSLID